MKNQYYGDINDYHKFGILRELAGDGGLRLAVCWMLTHDDGRADGRLISYLEDESPRWREPDPVLFDALRQSVIIEERRHISEAEAKGVIPANVFYADMLSDHVEERQAYFERLHALAEGAELLFFDPDNGLEIPSNPKGHKHSNKYLYWDELARFYAHGHSLLVYQHFRRGKREELIRALTAEMIARTNALEVYAFRTAQVVFLLAPQVGHIRQLRRPVLRVAERWKHDIRVSRHQLVTEGL